MSLRRPFFSTALVLLIFPSCAWNTSGSTGCALDRAPAPLSEGLGESSGLSPTGHPGDSLVWTHNDSGGEAKLFAVDLTGRIRDSLLLELDPTDLEALERSRCSDGWCLYLADVGDNEEGRDDAVLYRLVEPLGSGKGPGAVASSDRSADPGPSSTATSSSASGATLDRGSDPQSIRPMALPIRFPHGPTDVEAMFVLPGDRIHLVSKGRSEPITVYRYPLPLEPGVRVTLEVVQLLTSDTPSLPAYLTGAAATTDGRRVAVRSYESLQLYRVESDTLAAIPGGRVLLRSLREAQGEAVAFLSDERIVLSSEAGFAGRRGGLVVLRCEGLSAGTEAGIGVG